MTRVTLVEQGGETQMKSRKIGVLLAAGAFLGVLVFLTHLSLTHSKPVISTATSESDPWDVLKIEQGQPDRVFFKNGKVVDTIGYELKYIGKMNLSSGPILLFSGMTCMECDDSENLIVYSVASDSVTWKSAYPSATASNLDDGKIFYQGRAFYGECLPGLTASIVAYVHSNIKGDEWKDTVFTYVFHLDGSVEEKKIDENPPNIAESLNAVSLAKCEELPHYDYTEE
jgi:hypothetical protein